MHHPPPAFRPDRRYRLAESASGYLNGLVVILIALVLLSVEMERRAVQAEPVLGAVARVTVAAGEGEDAFQRTSAALAASGTAEVEREALTGSLLTFRGINPETCRAVVPLLVREAGRTGVAMLGDREISIFELASCDRLGEPEPPAFRVRILSRG